MADSGGRRRAPGMSQEQRRVMIVAALPLVAEYGAAVTTSQIARAAGIGEATIFRAFADKDEVLDECMAEALRPDHVERESASIPLDQPIAARLTNAVDALRGYLGRMGAVAGTLPATSRSTPSATASWNSWNRTGQRCASRRKWWRPPSSGIHHPRAAGHADAVAFGR